MKHKLFFTAVLLSIILCCSAQNKRNHHTSSSHIVDTTAVTIAEISQCPDDIDLTNWHYIGKSTDENRFYAQTKFKKNASNTYTIWTCCYAINNKKSYRKYLYCNEINIDKMLIKVLSSILYNPKGTVINQNDTYDSQWKQIPPESIGEDLYKYIVDNHL